MVEGQMDIVTRSEAQARGWKRYANSAKTDSDRSPSYHFKSRPWARFARRKNKLDHDEFVARLEKEKKQNGATDKYSRRRSGVGSRGSSAG